MATLMAHAMLLVFALWGAWSWRDPLRLGSTWSWLAWAPLALALISDFVSPVPRAGWTGLALAPAFLFLPAAIDRCWRRGQSGMAAPSVALAVLAVSAWALLTLFSDGLPRAALPLGHHNLLAVFLVPLLPLVAAGLAKRGWRRWLGILSLALGITAVLATRSFDAAAALMVESVVIAFFWKRARPWALATVLLLAMVVAPRGSRVLARSDPSLHARATYADAGLRGIAHRPLLGWGPGSVPWTVGINMRPRLGVNPASEVVGDLHSLPLQWAYEAGLVGLAAMLALMWGFGRARLREDANPSSAFDRRWLLVAVAGLLVEALSNSQIEVVALPVMAAVLCGAWMAGGTDSAWRGTGGTGKGRSWGLLLLLIGAVALVPLDLAHCSYDWARGSDGATQVRRLEWATRLDPHFPLYRFRLAVSIAADQPRRAAAEALIAASGARGVAPLWLEAGLLARKAGDTAARRTLVRACRLDRLAPLPPFYAALSSPQGERAADLLAQSLLLEPRLAAAVALESRGALLDGALGRLAEMREVPARWRLALKHAVGRLRRIGGQGPTADLVLDADRSPYLSFSVYAFRRTPWPLRLASVVLRRPAVKVMASVPRLEALGGVSRSMGRALSCGSD